LAGRALKDKALQQFALEGVLAAYKRHCSGAHALSSSAICHGLAGLTQLLKRFAADSKNDELNHAYQSMLSELCSRFDRSTMYGFLTGLEPNATNNPGLFSGASGIGLVLLTASFKFDAVWDRTILSA
jgi:lantibiotic modifying enzyme